MMVPWMTPAVIPKENVARRRVERSLPICCFMSFYLRFSVGAKLHDSGYGGDTCPIRFVNICITFLCTLSAVLLSASACHKYLIHSLGVNG
ncbi:hypothetical protein FR991_03420 [Bacteroides fragilis]|nr:hypothetical protein E5C01_07500 [Bacteroides fragilis]QCQ40527.1 hypothetical protein HR50_007910 [Bacteroides fragilis]TWV04824.1 hypothetical protein FSA67_15020 [Bacteroides fragilis]TWV78484.1 hypothetical protein FR991_03420 [Bacteroides fragilis]